MLEPPRPPAGGHREECAQASRARLDGAHSEALAQVIGVGSPLRLATTAPCLNATGALEAERPAAGRGALRKTERVSVREAKRAAEFVEQVAKMLSTARGPAACRFDRTQEVVIGFFSAQMFFVGAPNTGRILAGVPSSEDWSKHDRASVQHHDSRSVQALWLVGN